MEGQEIARHDRRSQARLTIDPLHYEGASTERVVRPTPLGRRARLEMAGLSSPSRRMVLGLPVPERISRPMDAYVQLVEALRLVLIPKDAPAIEPAIYDLRPYRPARMTSRGRRPKRGLIHRWGGGVLCTHPARDRWDGQLVTLVIWAVDWLFRQD